VALRQVQLAASASITYHYIDCQETSNNTPVHPGGQY